MLPPRKGYCNHPPFSAESAISEERLRLILFKCLLLDVSHLFRIVSTTSSGNYFSKKFEKKVIQFSQIPSFSWRKEVVVFNEMGRKFRRRESILTNFDVYTKRPYLYFRFYTILGSSTSCFQVFITKRASFGRFTVCGWCIKSRYPTSSNGKERRVYKYYMVT